MSETPISEAPGPATPPSGPERDGRAAPKPGRGVATRPTAGALAFYRVFKPIIVGVCSLPWRVSVHGRENLPVEGAYVLAPSHRSMLDIPFAASVTSRRVRFMGKAPLFRIPVLGAGFRALGGFPVERDGTDRGPLRDSLEILRHGEPLVVYPEGTRRNGPEIQPLQPGAAYLAIKAQVPLVPVGIAGSEEAFRSRPGRRPGLGPAVVVVGEPLSPPALTGTVVKRALVDELSEQLRGAVQIVFDEAYRRRAER